MKQLLSITMTPSVGDCGYLAFLAKETEAPKWQETSLQETSQEELRSQPRQSISREPAPYHCPGLVRLCKSSFSNLLPALVLLSKFLQLLNWFPKALFCLGCLKHILKQLTGRILLPWKEVFCKRCFYAQNASYPILAISAFILQGHTDMLFYPERLNDTLSLSSSMPEPN